MGFLAKQYIKSRRINAAKSSETSMKLGVLVSVFSVSRESLDIHVIEAIVARSMEIYQYLLGNKLR